jgi:diaminopimelate epimerase
MRHDSSMPRGGLRFRKMHGLGNDFVVVDARGLGASPVTPTLARALGDRHRGIGFDQIAVIRDGADGPAVDFWNPDGSEAAACGNATRCVAAILMAEAGSDSVMLTTGRGRLRAEGLADGRVRVDMGPPVEDWRAIPLARDVPLDALPLEGAPSAIGMGNPHCVFIVEDAEAVPIETLGPRVESDPLFTERTNVEFVQVIDRGTIRMRVWERGLGVTLACGSGACAAVVATARRGLTDRQVVVHLDGGPLEIDWRADGVRMTGPVSDVFEGVLSPAFARAAP